MKLILALAAITLLTSCGGGGGDDSNTTTDTPQTPSAPIATVQGAYRIDLSWSAVSGASYYRLYNGSTEIYTNNGTIYNHTGLTANTNYSYTLKACTDSNSNTCSSASSAISATTQDNAQTIPQTPSAPTASVESYSQINLSWSAVSGASYYRLYNSDSSNDEIYAGSNTIYNHTGLGDNTFYSYTLKACTDSDINTCSNASSATSATTTQVPSATLNDTGITLGGNATGNNSTCSSSITAPQDCHYGRDTSLTISDSTFTYVKGIQTAKVGAGAAGFDFTKLSSTGATLSLNSTDSWSCVKDNVTGLIWEVKTNIGASDTYTDTITDGTRTYTYDNIHHKDNIYRWGGLSALGRGHASREGTYYDDWDVLVDGSNSERLCGFIDWRVPTINELRSIAHQGKKTKPTIDTNYFPNTAASYFWSASPYAYNSSGAWRLDFSNGDDGYGNRTSSYRVRLVRVGE